MINFANEKVKNLIFEGNFGLERESLRITKSGYFSQTPHPFPRDNKNIVYDFCENQTEINTDVSTSAKGALELLKKHVVTVQNKLMTLDEPELFWPFSNPPYIVNDANIPIAEHVESAGYKKGYREYLAERYGRYKMALCGIHVNYSFSDELLKASFDSLNGKDFFEYKNQIYVELAEKVAYYGWVITILTAASPLLDSSYIEKGKYGNTAFNGMASTRCSEFGYWNHFAAVFDYSNIKNYAKSIQKYVDENLIAASTELYYPVRVKTFGKSDLSRFNKDGVSHIELRMVDLNPYELAGMNVDDLEFCQLFLIWLACTPMEPLSVNAQVQAVQNFKNAAHYDLKTICIVFRDGKALSAVDAGLLVISKMKEFYKNFNDDNINRILNFEEEKLIYPEKRYSWKIRKEFEDDFVNKGIKLAQDQQKEVTLCANYLALQEEEKSGLTTT